MQPMTLHPINFAKCLFGTLLALALHANAARASFMAKSARFDLSATHDVVRVTKDGIIFLEKESAEKADGSTFIADFNFDKIPDFAVLRDSGIERHFDVYIFDAKSGTYLFNKPISELACPAVDARKKLVLSTCNHASACEKWQDSFTMSKAGLTLVRRDSTTCDPASGLGFKYFETYRNNRIIHKKTKPIDDRINE
jgi:hypothetical protein